MVFPWGVFVNAGAIAAGTGIGTLLGNRLSEQMRLIVFQGLGLCCVSIGMRMSFATLEPLYMVISILAGAVIGEGLKLEDKLFKCGDMLKTALKSESAEFTDGFVSASILFCVGSMAILGSLQEGTGGGRTIVLTKSLLDFFAAIAFSTALGIGVAFSAFSIILYQGSLTLLAGLASPYITEMLRLEITAVGGIMIVGIGLNLLNLLNIRLTNLLPALAVIILICLGVSQFSGT